MEDLMDNFLSQIEMNKIKESKRYWIIATDIEYMFSFLFGSLGFMEIGGNNKRLVQRLERKKTTNS